MVYTKKRQPVTGGTAGHGDKQNGCIPSVLDTRTEYRRVRSLVFPRRRLRRNRPGRFTNRNCLVVLRVCQHLTRQRNELTEELVTFKGYLY